MLTAGYYSMAVIDDVVLFLCQHPACPSMHASIFSSVSLQQAGCDRQERTAPLLLCLPPAYWFPLTAACNVKSGMSPLV